MIRKKQKFSEFGSILQEQTLEAGETAEIFTLEMPKNHIGFLYYMANDYFPLKLFIDDEKIDINEIIAPIDSPKLFDPPYLIEKFIKVSATNKTAESRKMRFYADGVAYSILTVSEETFIKEIKGEKEVLSQTTVTPPLNVKEIIPTTAHIINHNLHDANKWYEIKLSRNLVTWLIRARGNHEIKYSYSPTHQTWRTLASGEILSADVSPNAELNAVYVMSEEGGIVVELETWTK